MSVAAGGKIRKYGHESDAFRIAGIALSASTGFCLGAFVRRRISSKRSPLSPSPMPLKDGAVSAVTGGHPEEMNEMPPAVNPDKEGPVYDGSSLH